MLRPVGRERPQQLENRRLATVLSATEPGAAFDAANTDETILVHALPWSQS